MFGYNNNNNNNNNNNDGCLGGCMVALIIGIFILVLLAYFFGIILAIFLGIGAFIGLIYALVVFIKAFIYACQTVRSVTGRNGITTLLLRWWHLFKVSTTESFKNNFSIAQSAILKSGAYRTLSFKKWMWFIVAPSVMVVGTLMIAAVAFFQLFLLGSILSIILMIAAVIVGIYSIIAIGYAIFQVIKILAGAFGMYRPFSALNFSRYFLFSDLGVMTKDYFGNIIQVVKGIWNDTISLISTNYASARAYPHFNVIRIFLLVTPIVLVPFALLFIALMFVIMSILYIPLFIAEFFWAILAKIIK